MNKKHKDRVILLKSNGMIEKLLVFRKLIKFTDVWSCAYPTSACYEYIGTVWKFDLASRSLYNGYIIVDQRYMCTHYSLHLHHTAAGTFLFNMNSMYRLEDFDFDDPNNHSAERIALSSTVENHPMGLTADQVQAHNDDVGADLDILSTSSNGCIYCVYEITPNVERYIITKLDMPNYRWKYMCTLPDGVCMYSTGLFTYNSMLCVACGEKILCFMEEDGAMVQQTCIDDRLGGSGVYCVIPAEVCSMNSS